MNILETHNSNNTLFSSNIRSAQNGLPVSLLNNNNSMHERPRGISIKGLKQLEQQIVEQAPFFKKGKKLTIYEVRQILLTHNNNNSSGPATNHLSKNEVQCATHFVSYDSRTLLKDLIRSIEVSTWGKKKKK